MIVFISYDTGEIEWALFVKEAIERRLPSGGRAFVAKRDIRPGEEPLKRMLEEELKSAKAVVAICSRRSKTSPWLWWEASAVWARGEKVFPLFLGIDQNEFGAPLSSVAQGPAFDEGGVDATLLELIRHVAGPNHPTTPLTTDERAKIAALRSTVNQSPLDVDTDGPSCIHEEAHVSYRRVRVRNLGRTTIRGVEVKLDDFQPQGATFLPLRLQRMHGLPHPFDANPGDEIYIDAVALVKGATEFALCHDRTAHPSTPNGIAVGEYTLTLSITGIDVPASKRQFVAGLDGSGTLTLRPLVTGAK